MNQHQLCFCLYRGKETVMEQMTTVRGNETHLTWDDNIQVNSGKLSYSDMGSEHNPEVNF
jgi:hypothetical protein